ncbi:MAG: S41 family peptidase [Chloroflexota bacterium]
MTDQDRMSPEQKHPVRRATVDITPLQLFVMVGLIFVLGLLVGSQAALSGVGSRVFPAEDQETLLPFYQTFRAIEEDYIGDYERDDLIDAAISGMVDALGDVYSAYLTPETYRSLNVSLSGDVEGIGASVAENQETGELEVVAVLPDTPAEAAGVQVGDVFVAVDGQDVTGQSLLDVLPLVRGPAGSTVTITFRRNGELVELTITRGRFEAPTVFQRVLDDDIAYISVRDFNTRSREQLLEALDAVEVNTRRGLVIDMRGNPGGRLSAAVEVASLFIEDGVVLVEEFADGTEQVLEADGSYAGVDVPLVVLVDGRSASAAELFAGALRDSGSVTVVGEQTYGKGSVQIVRELANGGALRLTISRWLTPDRESIDGAGITPDVMVALPEDYDFARDGDLFIETAVDLILDVTVSAG